MQVVLGACKVQSTGGDPNDGELLLDAMSSIEFMGFSGKVKFDKTTRSRVLESVAYAVESIARGVDDDSLSLEYVASYTPGVDFDFYCPNRIDSFVFNSGPPTAPVQKFPAEEESITVLYYIGGAASSSCL